MKVQYCPCGNAKGYADCCGRFIEQGQIPQTPEELMRSRYTAYSKANITYIAKTMKGKASLGFDEKSAYQWASNVTWKKLTVLNASQNGTRGFVEFIAYFEDGGKQQTIHEKSEFLQENDSRWYYVDGLMVTR